MSASVFSPLGPYERLQLHCHIETPLHWTEATERDTAGTVRDETEVRAMLKYRHISEPLWIYWIGAKETVK